MPYKLLLIWIVALSWGGVLHAQEPPAEEPLEVSAPIRSAATKRMKVRTVINSDGSIVVFAEIPDILLAPGPVISAKPGNYNGTWRAELRLVPKVSSADAKQLRELANRLQEEALEKGKSDGELTKEEYLKSYAYFKNVADIVTPDFAYHINPLRGIAVEDMDRSEIDVFLHNLSKECQTVDGKDCRMLIREMLQPPVDRFR